VQIGKDEEQQNGYKSGNERRRDDHIVHRAFEDTSGQA
jgi:hypothetical protein